MHFWHGDGRVFADVGKEFGFVEEAGFVVGWDEGFAVGLDLVFVGEGKSV